MAVVSLEFIQSQLQSIQVQLPEIKTTADPDRRDTRSMYDNLATEMSRGLGELEVKLGTRIDGLAMLICTILFTPAALAALTSLRVFSTARGCVFSPLSKRTQ